MKMTLGRRIKFCLANDFRPRVMWFIATKAANTTAEAVQEVLGMIAEVMGFIFAVALFLLLVPLFLLAMPLWVPVSAIHYSIKRPEDVDWVMKRKSKFVESLKSESPS